jgi:hypothetical protein
MNVVCQAGLRRPSELGDRQDWIGTQLGWREMKLRLHLRFAREVVAASAATPPGPRPSKAGYDYCAVGGR